jgi:hypothetical protein
LRIVTKASATADRSKAYAFGFHKIFDGLVFDDDQSFAVGGALGL